MRRLGMLVLVLVVTVVLTACLPPRGPGGWTPPRGTDGWSAGTCNPNIKPEYCFGG